MQEPAGKMAPGESMSMSRGARACQQSSIQLRIAIVVGVILAMPVLLYQVWAFVAPGLTAAERRALRPWIPLALFFFVLGVSIAYIILPFAIQFLLAFTDQTIVAHLAAMPYFDFVTTMFLAFGLLMEFPIVLYGLARVGILSSTRLRNSRRFIFLGIVIFSTIATPGGDLVSPTVLAATSGRVPSRVRPDQISIRPRRSPRVTGRETAGGATMRSTSGRPTRTTRTSGRRATSATARRPYGAAAQA